jgi:hypothetical protein
MRFNQPPNWPAAPPGWTPPPGWQPDPSWPPPPPGWPLWVPEGTRRRNGLIIGMFAAVAAVAIVATVLAVVLAREPKPSDEEQIRAVLTGMANAWNDSDWDQFKSFVCDASLQEGDTPTDEDLQKDRDRDGRSELAVHSLEITGDKASAEVEQTYENKDEPDTEDVDFVRENGEWKLCFAE